MQPVQTVTQAELDNIIAKAATDVVIPILGASQPGHCLRISSLSAPAMLKVCAELNRVGVAADAVYILGPHQTAHATWQIASTRLIALRNAEKRPLLAFVPPGLRAAAEDSFDISTFKEIDLGEVPERLLSRLRDSFPADLGAMIDRVSSSVRQHGTETNELLRYYLTVAKNKNQPEVVGGALYELGLVPDFSLLQNPALIEVRLARNIDCCAILKDAEVSLLARIHTLGLAANSLQSALYRYLRSKTVADIPSWAAPMVADPALHPLCFDRWVFEGQQVSNKILIFVDELGLKPRDESSPLGPDNPPYLDVNRATSLKVGWTTDPRIALVPAVNNYRIEIISTDGDLVAWESKSIPAARGSHRIKVKDFRDSVEDGLYYLRVRAFSEGGELLNYEDPEESPAVLRDPHNPLGKRVNATEDVWFWKEEGEAPPVEPARNVTVNSFLDAQLQVRLTALDRGANPFDPNLVPRQDRTGWFESKGKGTESSFQITYDAQTKFTLPVSALLRRIESETLSDPENLGRWRLVFGEGVTIQTAEPSVRKFHHHDQVPPAFLEARTKLFQAIQGGNQKLLVSTVDLVLFADLIVAYAAEYTAWLEDTLARFDDAAFVLDESGRRRTEAVVLDIDTLQLEIPNDTPLNDRVYVTGPTHPLRLLWHLQRSLLATSWLERALQTDEPSLALPMSLREFLRRGLAPVNLPPFVRPTHESFPYGVPRFYLEQGPLTPFWSLHLAENVEDRRALFTRVKSALGINRSSTQAGAVGGIDQETLARKIQRYLIQHPYVQILKINVFNPGDAGLLVDAILRIERERLKGRLPGLRYELRLFTRGAMPDDIGEAVEDLANPERQVSPEADAFSQPSQNHLFPKLRLYRNRVDDFLEHHAQYEAHISLLHDVFPVDVDVDQALSGRSSFLHGLVQDQVTSFGSESKGEYVWRRQLRPAFCRGLTPDDRLSSLMAKMLDQLAEIQASVAIGKHSAALRPTLRLGLRLTDKNLINLVHKTTDWVLIIDKNLGLEYFDSGPSQGGSIYVLDFAPEFASIDTDRLFLTTQVTDEITGLMLPALVERGLDRGEGVEVFFLNMLRSLSGRLALKLLSTPTDVSGVLGLALARLFLEQFGLLEDCILIPIDSHVDVFTQAGRDSALAQEVSYKRGDLLVVQCDPPSRTLHINIIEAKLRSDLGDANAYLRLRQDIESQLSNTESELRAQFDPDLEPLDRLDRQLKNRELFALLSFYLERSQRFGLIGPDAARTLHQFLQALDDGYHLTISGVGLILDFASGDLTVDEEHAGLVFYRVGKDYLQRMVDTGMRQATLLQETLLATEAIAENQQQTARREEILATSDMHKDAQYERVRTSFPKSTGPKSGPEPRNAGARAVQASHKPMPKSSKIAPSPSSAAESRPPSGPARPPGHADLPPQRGQPMPPSPGATDAPKPPEAVPHDGPTAPTYDVLIAEVAPTPQYGILGKAGGRVLALDLNGTNTISLFGVQGGGKSYTLGTIAEMATQQLPGINLLPSPLATVIFHYHESQDYPPEFVSMVRPNADPGEVKTLVQEYGAEPTALRDSLVLTSQDKLAARRAEFPGVQVEPISFSSRELSFKDWRFLMGVGGNQMYVKQMNIIMRQLREGMTVEGLRDHVQTSDLTDQQKSIASLRLDFAAQFIDDERQLADVLRPGRLIIVDLRDELIDKDEALGLFVVMLNIFANARREVPFNKLIVFDEAHKYMDNPDLTGHIVDVIRQMRHQGVSVMIASQDPPALPSAIIELSSLVVLHRFNSPQWLKHIQKSITALADLTPQQMASLSPGEAFVWATKSTERIFTQKPVRVHFRPRLTEHGGTTRTAL